MNKTMEILYNEWLETKAFDDDSLEYRKAIRILTNDGEDPKKFEILYNAVSAERIAAFEKGFYDALSLLCRFP